MNRELNYFTLRELYKIFGKNAKRLNSKQAMEIFRLQLKFKLEVIPALQKQRKENFREYTKEAIDERYNRFVERKYNELKFNFELISKLKDSLQSETSVNETYHRLVDLVYSNLRLKFQIISGLRDSLRK